MGLRGRKGQSLRARQSPPPPRLLRSGTQSLTGAYNYYRPITISPPNHAPRSSLTVSRKRIGSGKSVPSQALSVPSRSKLEPTHGDIGRGDLQRTAQAGADSCRPTWCATIRVYGTEDLICSFDVVNVQFPNRKDAPENKKWPHQDQDPERPGFR